MFDDENCNYKLKFLEEVKNYLFLENVFVVYDNDLFKFKKIVLGGDFIIEMMDNIFLNA